MNYYGNDVLDLDIKNKIHQNLNILNPHLYIKLISLVAIAELNYYRRNKNE